MSHTSSSHVDLQAILADSSERLCCHYQAIDDLFPTGVGTHYELAENDDSLTGFWASLLWLTYADG